MLLKQKFSKTLLSYCFDYERNLHTKICIPPKGRLREIIWMQHYQIFKLSDGHVLIKKCHLWYIEFEPSNKTSYQW